MKKSIGFICCIATMSMVANYDLRTSMISQGITKWVVQAKEKDALGDVPQLVKDAYERFEKGDYFVATKKERNELAQALRKHTLKSW